MARPWSRATSSISRPLAFAWSTPGNFSPSLKSDDHSRATLPRPARLLPAERRRAQATCPRAQARQEACAARHWLVRHLQPRATLGGWSMGGALRGGAARAAGGFVSRGDVLYSIGLP